MAVDEKMTARQAEKEIENFKRYFRPSGCSRLRTQTISGNPAEKNQSGCEKCNFQKMEQQCQNCVVANAAASRSERGKLEVFDGVLYQLIARYVEIGGKRVRDGADPSPG